MPIFTVFNRDRFAEIDCAGYQIGLLESTHRSAVTLGTGSFCKFFRKNRVAIFHIMQIEISAVILLIASVCFFRKQEALFCTSLPR